MVHDGVLPSLRLTRRRIRIPVAAVQGLLDSEPIRPDGNIFSQNRCQAEGSVKE
jgi:hypothetical protein